jgi:hypothetical protein
MGKSRRHSQELPHGSHMQSLSAMSSKYRLDSVSADLRTMPKHMQRVKDAGDVPFIFSPELEAATAAKLHAALHSTSPAPPSSSTGTLSRFSAFTSGNGLNYAAAEDAYASRPFGYGAVQDARPANGHVNGEAHQLGFGGGTSSSSLQGWAG